MQGSRVTEKSQIAGAEFDDGDRVAAYLPRSKKDLGNGY
jgi:hypothetical protein